MTRGGEGVAGACVAVGTCMAGHVGRWCVCRGKCVWEGGGHVWQRVACIPGACVAGGVQ